MDALPLLALIGGIVFGVIVRILRPPEPKRRPRPRPSSNKLDTIDEMFLYGEVNHDDFYGM